MQCGASLPTVAPEVASVPCPSCGHVHRVEGALLEQMHGHRRAVADAQQAAAQAGEYVAIADTTRSFGSGWAWLIIGSWILAGFVAIPQTPLFMVLALVIAFAPLVAIGVLGSRRHQQATSEVVAGRAAEVLIVVHCPTCGGQSELAPADLVSACRYCGGALAAEAKERESMLAAALASRDSEARKAQIAGWRLAAHGNSEPRTDLAPYFVFGLLGGTMALATLTANLRQLVAFDPEIVHGTELLVLNLISAAVIAALATPLLLKRRRHHAWVAQLEVFAGHSGGRHHAKLEAFADYLALHWYGDWPGQSICAARGFGLIVASGPPHWAVSVTPSTQKESVAHRHLRVLIPGDAEGSLLAAYATRLQAIGLETRCVAGGLVALALEDRLDRFLADGGLESLAEVLASDPSSAS